MSAKDRHHQPGATRRVLGIVDTGLSSGTAQSMPLGDEHHHKRHRSKVFKRKSGIKLEEISRGNYKIPSAAWNRNLSHSFPEIRSFGVGFWDAVKVLPLGWRMWKHTRAERAENRLPIMDPFNTLKTSPLMGVPLGGIGCGSITRGWRGDFTRWTITPTGVASVSNVEADQFSIRIQRNSPDSVPIASVLHPGPPPPSSIRPNKAPEANWEFKMDGSSSDYFGLFPRAWSFYRDLDPNLVVSCKQISPVIAHNYKESSYPVGVFVWEFENTGEQDCEVSLMWTFQNGSSNESSITGGHYNETFKGDKVTGIKLVHNGTRTCRVEGQDQTFDDKIEFGMGVLEEEGLEISWQKELITNSGSDCKSLWQKFERDGFLDRTEGKTEPSKKNKSLGAALVVKFKVEKAKKSRVCLSLGWDSPQTRFGSGRTHWKRYTRFYGREGNCVQKIVEDSLKNWEKWDKAIEEWQNPILEDSSLPDFYKGALFNELYFMVDGGTIWTADPPEHDFCEKLKKPVGENEHDEEIGRFAYLEGLEYLMYNTYDVHFYASFALIMNWPKLELSLQRDFAEATVASTNERWSLLHSGEKANRKIKGAVPHDLGNPGDDPWVKTNSYNIQDVSRWKDLPSKFILQVYRDYVATKDLEFLKTVFPVVLETFEFLKGFDKDGDGLIENEGFPDQTYDIWSANGPSAYCGGLWLASVAAVIEMSKLLPSEGDEESLKELTETLNKGKQAYHEKLWNGTYFNYDCDKGPHSDSIMADQLAGHWYSKICNLDTYVQDEEMTIKSALQTVFDFNVVKYGKKYGEKQHGHWMGAVNGMRPDGTPDSSSIQSQEVWTGTTYAVASTMLLEGLDDMAFSTARGIIDCTYETLGYAFQTPEGWDSQGRYRAFAYQRPLSIWSMQWAWEMKKKVR